MTDTPFQKVLSYPLKEKRILWLSRANKYLIASPPADEIITQILTGAGIDRVRRYCLNHVGMEADQAELLVEEIITYIKDQKLNEVQKRCKERKLTEIISLKLSHLHERYYRIFGIGFKVAYATEEIEDFLHPKFAHLEVLPGDSFSHEFIVFSRGKGYGLSVDGYVKGSWGPDEGHYLTGKFSMEILQKIYQLDETGWMGVFHAAAISDGQSSIIFPGGSGNGKSTLCAILMSVGMDVLADDFLPVEGSSDSVCRFPAAISIKKQGCDLLLPQFPALAIAKEYHHSLLNKTFRYLVPERSEAVKLPCKAMIFIKYEPGNACSLNEMSHELAFQQLIPDSWLSPKPLNAKRFLEWFLKLPCYQLTYSDNAMMIAQIRKMLSNEL